jgi:hypothetical protein
LPFKNSSGVAPKIGLLWETKACIERLPILSAWLGMIRTTRRNLDSLATEIALEIVIVEVIIMKRFFYTLDYKLDRY